MSKHAKSSQVKFEVRHNALMLREFTVADIARVTDLNPESIRTEIQRMKRKGWLTSSPHPKKPSRGRRPMLYKLIDNPEHRLQLSQSIDAFFSSRVPNNTPVSQHYFAAQKMLNQAMNADETNRQILLKSAERDLEIAEHTEGGYLASKSVDAYLKYERARLSFFSGIYDEAEKSLLELRDYFTNLPDETVVKQIDELLLLLKVQTQLEVNSVSTTQVSSARLLTGIINEENYQTDSPLAASLAQAVSDLLQFIDSSLSLLKAMGKNRDSSRQGFNRIETQTLVNRIYATNESELICSQMHELLPVYVEAEFEGEALETAVIRLIETHLHHCTDCTELYHGIYFLIEQEAGGEIHLEDPPKPVASSQHEPGPMTPVTSS